MIVNLQFGLLVLIVSGIPTFFAAEWSEWMDITPCSSKPCECKVPYNTTCSSNGFKAQIRRCIRAKGEIDSCKGGGPFQVVKGCDNKHICPGWSEWTEWSECDCSTNQRNKERRCNNPPPIHPDVLCMKYNSDPATEETSSQACQCSAEEELAETTLPTTNQTNQPGTTERPWCCEMYEKNDPVPVDEYIGNYDVPEDSADREARSADYYHYYDSICRECSVENGYKGGHGKPEDNNSGQLG